MPCSTMMACSIPSRNWSRKRLTTAKPSCSDWRIRDKRSVMNTITVEKIEPFAYKMGCAHVIDGERACPPEDVGGPFGYEAFLKTLQEAPDSEQAHANLLWLGGSFTPDAFDRRGANHALLRMGWNGWGKK